jgi:hypothetical protein
MRSVTKILMEFERNNVLEHSFLLSRLIVMNIGIVLLPNVLLFQRSWARTRSSSRSERTRIGLTTRPSEEVIMYLQTRQRGQSFSRPNFSHWWNSFIKRRFSEKYRDLYGESSIRNDVFHMLTSCFGVTLILKMFMPLKPLSVLDIQKIPLFLMRKVW